MKIGLTTILAIWGAVLSTLTVVWNLLRDRRDRPNVKLTAELEQTVQDSYGQPIPVDKGTASGIVGTQLVVTITNVGRRSVSRLSEAKTFVQNSTPPSNLVR